MKSHTGKLNVYQRVTETICKKLEKGVAPWQSGCFAQVGLPKNFVSGNQYQGINVLLLGSAGYSSPWFLTFLQAKQLGGNVRKGEKGMMVVKCGTYEKESNQIDGNGEILTEQRHYLKSYTVFNASQIDGIDFPKQTAIAERNRSETIEAAERIVSGMPNPPTINEGRKTQPHYLPKTDTVEMPGRECFSTLEGFFHTLFHEISHSTGINSRLNRYSLTGNSGINSAGEAKEIYSKEELVAEMGSAFLSATAGIVVDEHEKNAAYIASWLEVLRSDDNQRWIAEAAAQAQKSTDYILGRLE